MQWLAPTMLYTDVDGHSVSVINCDWWRSPVYYSDRPPTLTAPEMISRSRGMVGANQNLNGSRDVPMPLKGWFAIRGLALATVNLPTTTSTKFEVFISTQSLTMKIWNAIQNVENGAVWGS